MASASSLLGAGEFLKSLERLAEKSDSSDFAQHHIPLGATGSHKLSNIHLFVKRSIASPIIPRWPTNMAYLS